MSERLAKKFRKTIRKKTDRLSQGIMGSAAFKIARQRGKIFLVAICEFAIIIALILWIVL